MANNDDAAQQDIARQALDQLRNRLLDLTARNRLLNFRHTRKSSLRVVDEIPDQLIGLLLDGKELRFAPVPVPTQAQLIEAGYLGKDPETGAEVVLREAPSATQWAAYCGISVDYELSGIGTENSQETEPAKPVPVGTTQPSLLTDLNNLDTVQADSPASDTASSNQPSNPVPQSPADPAPIKAVPPEKHTDSVIQTLFYPEELETIVRGLSQKAESAVQEMGTNILYLSFGFLEWSEADHSDATRIAPLLLLPVTIEKGRLNKKAGTFEYRLSYSGEDIVPNLSLQEKLRHDFGLMLPELPDPASSEEENEPYAEHYFSTLEAMLHHSKPDWCVRRYISLSLLNFHKLLMYLDLDSKRWPDNKGLEDHPVVKQFLGTQPTADSSVDGFSAEHQIDNIDDVHWRYPLIYDADSSQHSAIIDVLDGKSLVIEGPPGTGKSQSITNLIAAAISDGKRVLFVAEKLAALQVVKSRLDQAGLGEFCLELHSHKTQKRQLLNSIEERLNAHGQYRDATEIDADINRYEKLKLQLKQHVELINSNWKNTRRTPYQVFTAATRFRDSLPFALSNLTTGSEAGPDHHTPQQFTPAFRQQLSDQLDRYRQIVDSVASQLQPIDDAIAPGLGHHPWYGVKRFDLVHQDTHALTQALSQWQNQLERLISLRDSLSQQLQCEPLQVADSVESMAVLAVGLKKLPLLNPNISAAALPALSGETLHKCQYELAQFEQMHRAGDALLPAISRQLNQGVLPTESLQDSAVQITRHLKPDITLDTALQITQRASRISSDGDALLKQMQHGDIATHAQTVLCHSSINSLLQSHRFLELLADLDPDLSLLRHPRFESVQIEEALTQLGAQVSAIHQQKKSLSSVFNIRKLGDEAPLLELQQVLNRGGLLGWFNRNWRAARATLKKIAATDSVSVSELRKNLPLAIRFSGDCAQLKDHLEYARLLGEHYQGVNTDTDALLKIRQWYKRVSTDLNREMQRGLTALPPRSEHKLRRAIDNGALSMLQEIIDTTRQTRQLLVPGDLLHNDDIPLLGNQGALQTITATVGENATEIKHSFGTGNISVAEVNQQLAAIVELTQTTAQWQGEILPDNELASVFQLDIATLQRNSPAHGVMHATLSFVTELEDCEVCDAVKLTLRQSPHQYTIDELHEISAELTTALESHAVAKKAFLSEGDISHQDWCLHSGSDLTLLHTRNSNALNYKSTLMQWMNYQSTAAQLGALGFAGVALCCEQGDLPVAQIHDACLAVAYDELAREILRECSPLAEFSGGIQQSLRKQFAETDQKIQQLQRERIAWRADQNEIPEGRSGGYVRDLTELKLLRHECSKKTRHIPIRQLLSRATNALVQLKPCFMMGPLSAAQYLERGELEFDVVIMDEASQIKPEDSLGVIARGRQLVVVGDPKQLPPTNFFDRVVEDDDEETTTLGEQESILDATIPMFESRRLRWHYRSQHESLIAFSNQNFYDNDLVLFPSPARQSEEFGVKHVQVGGYFAGRVNVQEANAIADAVAVHFQQYPNDSVGVVAMNSNQRELIDATLDAKAKDDAILREALERNADSEEPLFIKNLENVQGDERDVILISMTYGPAAAGAKVYQRFGPVNSDTGWRRLNVLLTRSRKRMQVFTSMSSADIVAGESSRRGVVALKDLLAFLETGIVHATRHTGRQPDSDFEIAVIDRLEQRGYTCVPQIGVAGFFIDIAVVDPANEGHYLMGIECDGATYHSAKTVRDRDRLREAVLKRLGWRIRRIWSTDWFKNPDAEMQRILHELQQLSAKTLQLAGEPDDQAADAMPADSAEGSALQPPPAAPNETPKINPAVAAAAIAPVHDLPRALVNLAAQIEVEFPKHSARQRLLRASMQEALLEFKPQNTQEFEANIPGFLRRSIAAAELDQYLPTVLATIAAAREK